MQAVTGAASFVLDRQIERRTPNQNWAADFTYIWDGGGWLLCSRRARSLFSRRVAGWSMSRTMTAELSVVATASSYDHR
jgi:putative transposase